VSITPTTKLATWLVVERGVTHVAMESTGPYWWPVYAALREVGGPGLTIEVVNAAANAIRWSWPLWPRGAAQQDRGSGLDGAS
jgi:hypothetical protein